MKILEPSALDVKCSIFRHGDEMRVIVLLINTWDDGNEGSNHHESKAPQARQAVLGARRPG